MWRSRLACLVGALVLLSLAYPAAGEAASKNAHAKRTESGESSATALSSAGLLAIGAGYGEPGGSRAVRRLQLRLRAEGADPGPVDGLFGPLTRGAVERFQQAHGLTVDGAVGPQTRGRLLPGPTTRASAGTTATAANRSASPSRSGPAVRSSPPKGAPAPAGPSPPRQTRPQAADGGGSSSSTGLPSDLSALVLAALLGAFAIGLVVLAPWNLRARRRAARPDRARLNLGIVCAALLAVFALGASMGAFFASRAAPDERAGARAVSGIDRSASRHSDVVVAGERLRLR